jgi:hypothetical protein
MKVTFIDEPELEFGSSGRHIDIRYGLKSFGPLDAGTETAPRVIRLGLVGTQETVEGIQNWLTKCEGGVAAKATPLLNLFPSFPGYGDNSCFQSRLEFGQSLTRSITKKTIEDLAKRNDQAAVADAVDLFFDETRQLVEKGGVDVIICALPLELANLDADDEGELSAEIGKPEQEYETRLDLRNWLKAKTMTLGKPIQLVLPPTYDESKKRKLKTRDAEVRQLQDEATRAWNFHIALYYKAGGTPWRIVRTSGELSACHVGISFYRTLDHNQLMTSMAQVYNERGDGVIVRGAPVQLTKEDRQPHLSAEDSYKLLHSAMEQYRKEHKTLPARVVVHKSSSYNPEELDGLTRAVRDQRIELLDFLTVAKCFSRLYRAGQYPPLRGTLLNLDASTEVLYTRGSVAFYSTYPGLYVPRPLKIRCVETEQTPHFLAQEILALTKLNWNNTQFDGGEPITLRVARKVGDILKYVPDNQAVQPRYSFYM